MKRTCARCQASTKKRLQDLDKQIEDAKADMSFLEGGKWRESLWSASSITDFQKFAAFDRLYEMAMQHLQVTVDTGCPPKDGKYYIFEAVMELCLGPKAFDVLNRLARM